MKKKHKYKIIDRLDFLQNTSNDSSLCFYLFLKASKGTTNVIFFSFRQCINDIYVD